mmetsp:Transcript_34066/g.63592  ORF Transcript_34066/g.63592 Transcript_34066/m.63592 type:complete len:366 (+) Transcript_34066:106-1203(+)
MTREIKLVLYTCTLYVSFIYWGYLQEKITSSSYTCGISDSGSTADLDGPLLRWNYPRALNVAMAATASLFASVVDDILLPLFSRSANDKKTNSNLQRAPFMLFSKPAITCAIGSPLGYMALKYIPFPLVILTKSSKPIPVMLIGIIFYRKSYPWYKHVGTFLLCSGIVAFSYWKQSGPGGGGASVQEGETDGLYSLCIGLLLVVMNLSLDGYTNNEQEHIFKNFNVSSFRMMKNVNIWQVIFLLMYLVFMHLLGDHRGGSSELQESYYTIIHCPEARFDIAVFCFCAAVGQLTIFLVMKEFGSLMWITISITRKLFTILVSVVMFNHAICFEQWLGVAAVFSGLTLEVVMSYWNKQQAVDTKKKD